MSYDVPVGVSLGVGMIKSKSLDIGLRLKALRQEHRITQAKLAAALGIGQTALSHSEQREDALVSTVAAYVAALGGTLTLQACIGGKVVDLLDGSPMPSSNDTAPDLGSQMNLPGIAEAISDGAVRDIVFSIHPEHSRKILSGQKTVELRRRFTHSVQPGARAYIYTTSPTRALTGSASIEGVVKLPLAELWKQHRSAACLDRSDFDAYFQGRDSGYAILLKTPSALKRPIGLTELRESCGFAPPQSYSYASSVLRTMLANGH